MDLVKDVVVSPEGFARGMRTSARPSTTHFSSRCPVARNPNSSPHSGEALDLAEHLLRAGADPNALAHY